MEVIFWKWNHQYIQQFDLKTYIKNNNKGSSETWGYNEISECSGLVVLSLPFQSLYGTKRNTFWPITPLDTTRKCLAYLKTGTMYLVCSSCSFWVEPLLNAGRCFCCRVSGAIGVWQQQKKKRNWHQCHFSFKMNSKLSVRNIYNIDKSVKKLCRPCLLTQLTLQCFLTHLSHTCFCLFICTNRCYAWLPRQITSMHMFILIQ